MLGFRGPSSEKGALRSQAADTTAPLPDPGSDAAMKPDSSSGLVEAAETEAAAQVEDATGAIAAAQDGAAAETNPQADAQFRPAAESPPQTSPPPPSVTDQPSLAAAPPPPPSPAPVDAAPEDLTRAKTATGPSSVPTTSPPTTPVAAKRAARAPDLPPAAASGGAALPSASTPTSIALGAFPDAQSALDAFASRFGGGASTGAANAPAVNETNIAAATARPTTTSVIVTVAPAAASSPVKTVNGQDLGSSICPNIVGALRAEAVVNAQPVIIVRTIVADPPGSTTAATTTDIVADRGTCAMLSQRVVTP